MMIEVTKLKHLGGHRLHATFSDGTAGEHDFSALLAESGPMGEPLRDPAYFARVFPMRAEGRFPPRSWRWETAFPRIPEHHRT
jgi:Protein of unknown function (DUF2442)